MCKHSYKHLHATVALFDKTNCIVIAIDSSKIKIST